MGNDEIKIGVCYGTTKHDLKISENATIERLSYKIEEITDVLFENQKILYRGRILTIDNIMTIKEVGLRGGEKLMVLGRQGPNEINEITKLFDELTKDIDGIEKKLLSAFSEIDGIKNGFLDRKLHHQSLTTNRKALTGLNEDFMKILEKLDGVELEDKDNPHRLQRKTLVKRIQKMMEKLDETQDSIRKLLKSAP